MVGSNTHFFCSLENYASVLYLVSSARLPWIKDVESKNLIANDCLENLWASLMLNDINSSQPLQNFVTVGSTESLLELNKPFICPPGDQKILLQRQSTCLRPFSKVNRDHS